ncbi:MAG TPA: 2Fe-2S iron-sulfur cluster-binding protein [Dissulfurispiraceae bacterium]|nr:2Fe-2S iron-sulfur cluster-binding protein [Dissulfurispiraceae bacterium]
MVSLKIDGKDVRAAEGATVLEAALQEGIHIPTLCYHKAPGPQGLCRLCIVEAEGPGLRRTILPSCNLTALEGLKIDTASPLIQSIRKTIVELLMANTPASESLLSIAKSLGVESSRFTSVQKDPCILCGLCVKVCRNSIGAAALSLADGGSGSRVVASRVVIDAEACIGCGTCANICPVQAIRIEDSQTDRNIILYGQVVNKMELVKCEQCGQAHATQKFISSVLSRLTPEQKTAFRNLCPECSRVIHAESLTGQIPPDSHCGNYG